MAKVYAKVIAQPVIVICASPYYYQVEYKRRANDPDETMIFRISYKDYKKYLADGMKTIYVGQGVIKDEGQ